jgi:ribose transport system ATP-binding protein
LTGHMLEMKGIDKRFFGVHALKQVDFTLEAGEVRGLIGENGAGKSTLMKTLGGVYQADMGQILINGRAVNIRNETDAGDLGISFIHQELSLFQDLDLATNIFIQHIPHCGCVVRKAKMRERARALLQEVGLQHCTPEQRLGSLQIGEQQLVEIARCLTGEIKLLVLDEPTSSLTSKEVKILFGLIKRMQAKGVSVIFISHRLDELFEICDNVTVMRDGEIIHTVPIAEVTQKDLIHMMIGRDLKEMYSESRHEIGKEYLRVEKLTHQKRFSDVSFRVYSGEIVGLYGLLGSGRSEIARSIYGLEPLISGKVYVNSQEVTIRDAEQAIRLGMGFVSEDRRKEGLCLDHSVKHNLSEACLNKLRRLLDYLDVRDETAMCNKNVQDYHIATDRLGKAVKYLSGGNQQKVVIAKWLNIEPRILILDEPTRGVDVGAKKEIYDILNELTRRGIAVLMISSELNEVMSVCDRVLVLRKGRLVDDIPANEMDKGRLLSASMGGVDN